jgi:hypothetical protein
VKHPSHVRLLIEDLLQRRRFRFSKESNFLSPGVGDARREVVQ